MPTQLAEYKYHALLKEPVWVLRKLVTQDDVRILGEQPSDEIKGEYEIRISFGLYGFKTIEARDKFCRTCQSATYSEDKIALPVTIPNIYTDEPLTTTIRTQRADTGPVTGSSTAETSKET